MSLSRFHIRIGSGPDRIEVSAKQAGQIIVIFALMITTLIGLVGIAIDVTYAWRNGLQVQRAADAAALAGVVYLPGNLNGSAPSATSQALTIAGDNGYTSGITVAANPANDHQLDVSITTQVPTFFIRLFGMTNWTISRTARAAFIMPVPMGSPLAYYGIGCLVTAAVPNPTCNTPATAQGNSGVPTYTGLATTSFNSLGAWGAVISYGGNANNGDAYSPYYNVGYTNPNPLYDADGYNYQVVLPGGGNVYLYDPGFCEMGQYLLAGSSPATYNYYGTGDHWISGDNNSGSTYSPVSTLYTLIDTHNQPLNPNAWTTVPSGDSGSTFVNEKGQDAANAGSQTRHGSGACDSYHDNWTYKLNHGGQLGAGTYILQVQTTVTGSNVHTNAENMFGILADGGSAVVNGVTVNPAVYGQTRMCVYNNLAGTNNTMSQQQFYMAKVDHDAGVGKTLQIDLFDVGDSTAGTMSILAPYDAAGNPNPTPAKFTYTTSPECVAGNSDSCSDTTGNRTSITVSKLVGSPPTGSTSSFNSTWIHISIYLGSSYPANDHLFQGGWWQVQYNVRGGNDTTTWAVNVAGNPVHLVPWP